MPTKTPGQRRIQRIHQRWECAFSSNSEHLAPLVTHPWNDGGRWMTFSAPGGRGQMTTFTHGNPWDWYIYLHLVDVYGKNLGRYINHTWMLWVRLCGSQPKTPRLSSWRKPGFPSLPIISPIYGKWPWPEGLKKRILLVVVSNIFWFQTFFMFISGNDPILTCANFSDCLKLNHQLDKDPRKGHVSQR